MTHPIEDFQKALLYASGDIADALRKYEASGDHYHGRRYKPGEACPGGDCLVSDARKALRALRSFGDMTTWKVQR